MDHTDTVVAKALHRKIDDSEKAVRSVAEATGIAYSTLYRKLNAQGALGFTFGEICAIGNCLGFKASGLLAEAERELLAEADRDVA